MHDAEMWSVSGHYTHCSVWSESGLHYEPGNGAGQGSADRSCGDGNTARCHTEVIGLAGVTVPPVERSGRRLHSGTSIATVRSDGPLGLRGHDLTGHGHSAYTCRFSSVPRATECSGKPR